MKIKLLTQTVLLLVILFSCQSNNDENNITPPSTLNGKWTLTTISGGFVGNNSHFPQGWITWHFNESNHVLTVANNNLYMNPMYDGLQTGLYNFENNYTPSNNSATSHSLKIIDNFESYYTINADTLFINNNQIADGYQYKLIRMTNCDENYLIFGHYYGECGGEKCIEKYKLKSDKIFEDINDVYPGVTPLTPPNYVQLPQDKFQMANDLMTYFPSTLLNQTNHVIGMPDASDGGGLYIEYHFNGLNRVWLIDQFKQNVPEDYHNFMDKVNEKISSMP